MKDSENSVTRKLTNLTKYLARKISNVYDSQNRLVIIKILPRKWKKTVLTRGVLLNAFPKLDLA